MNSSPAPHRAPAVIQRAIVSSVPWGLVAGIVGIVPFLLAKQGLSINEIANVVSVIRLPATLGVFLMPLLDAGFSKRTYSLVFGIAAAVAIAVGVGLLAPPWRLAGECALFVAFLSCRLFDGAVAAWIAHFSKDKEFGSLGAWSTALAFAGDAIISSLCMAALTQWGTPRAGVGLGIAVAILIGLSPLLRFPRAERPKFRYGEILRGTLPTIWRASRTPESLTLFLLFASPIGTAAVANLQDGMSRDFHTADATVIWVAGAGSAIAGCLGAFLGGRMAARWSDRIPYLYLLTGFAIATTSIVTALTPHGPSVFVGSELLYNLIVGAQNALYYALTWSLVSRSPVASTQLSLFASSFYVSQTYMTLVDGAAYKAGGVTGTFLVDGLSSLVFLVPAFFAIRHWRSRRQAQAEVASPIDEAFHHRNPTVITQPTT